MSGMSCSMTSSAQPVSALDAPEQRAERLGLPLGDAGRRLVEQQHRRVVGDAIARSTMRRLPVDSSRHELVAERAEAHQLDEVVDGPRDVAPPARTTPGRSSSAARWSRTSRWRSRPMAMFSATVSDGKMRASWNERPRPSQARRSGATSVMSMPLQQ